MKGVRLRVAATPGAFYYVAVEDPVNTVRDVIEAEFRAEGPRLDLSLEFLT